MANYRQIVVPATALVMLVILLSLFAPAHACGGCTHYTLTIETTVGGTTIPAPGNYTYCRGKNVTVTATSDGGYQLGCWLLDGSTAGSATNITITMCSNHTVEALFVTAVPEFPSIVPIATFFTASVFIALAYKKTERPKKPEP
ncbi:MAG TPA: hypothetical protein VK487_11410 [Candidatus Bathyarchaeia archaeon]|nr:hypothetical protein [Candidatus Bathyarchaeia archaeon]